MKKLSRKTARKIHDVIFESKDPSFIERFRKSLKSEAEMRMGLYGQLHDWQGTLLPSDVKQALAKIFGEEKLQKCNLLSSDGSFIELRVLSGALPQNIIDSYFHFNPKEAAEKEGIDFETFKITLKDAFKGTIGTPGADDFGILLDSGIRDKFHEFATVTGLGALRMPWPEEVQEKEIDPKSVYLVSVNTNPFAVKTM